MPPIDSADLDALAAIDSADLDALADLEQHPGYKLVRERIAAELERKRLDLELPAAGGFERGQVKALRTVLGIPAILRQELKAAL
jgi:hypothetical protein